MNALFPLPAAAAPVPQSRSALARRIAALLREREANSQSLSAASARFEWPPTPAELKMTYRGPLGPMEVDVDADWIRELIPEFSPRSRRGRRLRKLLRIYEQHNACILACREASGRGPLLDERNRIKGDLVDAAKAALDQRGRDLADVALQAAAILAARLDRLHDCPRAPAIVMALLELAARN